MNREIPPEVDNVKNWCLMTRRFQDAHFILGVKEIMQRGTKLTPQDTQKLIHILQEYTLHVDLDKKIKERLRWQQWGI